MELASHSKRSVPIPHPESLFCKIESSIDENRIKYDIIYKQYNDFVGTVNVIFKKIWYFIKLTRPLFLFGGALLYLLGTCMAVVDGAQMSIQNYIIGQLLVTSIQLMTQYSNEYFDLEGDRLNPNRTWFSGGSGVLATGEIAPQTALYTSVFFFGLSIVLLCVAGIRVPIVFVLGLISLLAAWSYSGPPLSLSKTGWGELSASLVVAFLVPVTGYAMQSGGRIDIISLLATCLPLILIHFAMLIAFQIPDRFADRAAGKRTLCVRIGEQNAVLLHNLAILTAFCIMIAFSILHWPGARFAWLALPLAALQLWMVRTAIIRQVFKFQWLTMGAISLFAITSALWLAGFAWLVLPM
jgi:1,4-dihydroxy-2-naphthoate polyprenyltransferase